MRLIIRAIPVSAALMLLLPLDAVNAGTSSFDAANLTSSKIAACDLGMSREETAAIMSKGPQPVRKVAELVAAAHTADALPEDAINCVPRLLYDYLGPLPWRFLGTPVGETQEIMVTISGMQRGSTIDRLSGRLTTWGIYGARSDGRDYQSIVGPKVPEYRARSLDPYRVDSVWQHHR